MPFSVGIRGHDIQPDHIIGRPRVVKGRIHVNRIQAHFDLDEVISEGVEIRRPVIVRITGVGDGGEQVGQLLGYRWPRRNTQARV